MKQKTPRARGHAIKIPQPFIYNVVKSSYVLQVPSGPTHNFTPFLKFVEFQDTKKRNAPNTDKNTNVHNLIYIYYKNKIHLRLRARLRAVRL